MCNLPNNGKFLYEIFILFYLFNLRISKKSFQEFIEAVGCYRCVNNNHVVIAIKKTTQEIRYRVV